MSAWRTRQQGVALVIGMIMLVLLTLMVISAINSGSIGLRIAANVQSQDEARAAAQQAIEQFVSSYANFYPTPTAKPATNYNINNDSTNPYYYSVAVSTPVCKRASKQIPPKSTACATGAKAGLYCWDTLWEIVATSTDTKSGVSQVVTQGVSITFPPAFNAAALGC